MARDMVFLSNFSYDHAEDGIVRFDYKVEIDPLGVVTFPCKLGRFSVAGFDMKFSRYVLKYVIQYYLTSGIFVIVSWVRHNY